MGRIRVLIADPDPAVEVKLVELLHAFEAYPAQVTTALHQDKPLFQHLAELVVAHRCHVVVLDKSLITGDEAAHRELCQLLKPAHCILHTGFTVATERAMRAFYARMSLVPIKRTDPTGDLLQPVIERLFREQHAGNLKIVPEALLRAVALETAMPFVEVRETLEWFFPRARTLTLEPMRRAQIRSTVMRDRSALLIAEEGDRVPVVLKIAARKKIETEAENYHTYIEGQLGGLRHARLERHIVLWEVGTAVYSFIGTQHDQLPTSFADYYVRVWDDKAIQQILRELFGMVWSRLYHRSAQVVPGDLALYDQYDTVWSHRLRRYLPFYTNLSRAIYFPGLQIPLLNPVVWALENSARSAVHGMRTAITHGDLHADNLLVDEDGHCWVIDFERSGRGPILQDFVELETDIVTRLIEIPPNNLSLLYDLACVLAAPANPTAPLRPTLSLLDSAPAAKAMKTITFLRSLAQEQTRYVDSREYLWGLLLNTLFLVTLLPEKDPRHTRALLFGSVLCERLDQWEH